MDFIHQQHIAVRVSSKLIPAPKVPQISYDTGRYADALRLNQFNDRARNRNMNRVIDTQTNAT